MSHESGSTTETGSSPWEYMSCQASGWTDPSMNADSYYGGTVPNFSTEGYAAYYIWARNATDIGPASSIRYFRLAPP